MGNGTQHVPMRHKRETPAHQFNTKNLGIELREGQGLDHQEYERLLDKVITIITDLEESPDPTIPEFWSSQSLEYGPAGELDLFLAIRSRRGCYLFYDEVLKLAKKLKADCVAIRNSPNHNLKNFKLKAADWRGTIHRRIIRHSDIPDELCAHMVITWPAAGDRYYEDFVKRDNSIGRPRLQEGSLA